MAKPAGSRKRQRAKVVVDFDMEARDEYITGFRKRKNERRKKALEGIARRERDDKTERRRMRREALDATLEEARKQRVAAGLEAEAGGEGAGGAAAPALTSEAAMESEFARGAFGHGGVVVSTTMGAEGAEDEEERLAREVKRMKGALRRERGAAVTEARLRVPTLHEVKRKKKQRFQQRKRASVPSKREKRRGGGAR